MVIEEKEPILGTEFYNLKDSYKIKGWREKGSES